eukprot:CAMPEP_0115709588 /NCGR_PEP_ID=MMETSP0272-20121206/72550_1 /TAXON_ID=71861 /ORGANISM="Scrippsiella trochoidea, Strain CCMP3099" /LENGTH=71 /DNA_ID=CAMNT_0003151205 /DNA_START=14 /DNA_END=227 /DNA_ORIENTATION=+
MVPPVAGAMGTEGAGLAFMYIAAARPPATGSRGPCAGGGLAPPQEASRRRPRDLGPRAAGRPFELRASGPR